MADFAFLHEEKLLKKRKRRKLMFYGVAAAFFVLITLIIYAVVYSPLFRIKKVSINIVASGSELDSDQLIANLKDFFSKGSKLDSILGPNNILIWGNNISGFIEKNPQVEELSISRDFFRRTVIVNAKGREKYGIWCQGAQTAPEASSTLITQSVMECSWFDKKGILFKDAPIVEGELLNKVSDYSSRPLILGDKVLEDKYFINLMKIFDILQISGLKIKSLEIQNLADEELATSMASGPKIYFSLRIDPGFTLPAIKAFQKTGLANIDYIDFRVENRAYYKTK